MGPKSNRYPLLIMILVLQVASFVAVLRATAPPPIAERKEALVVDNMPSLQELADASDIVVRGHVRSLHSYWADDRSAILTDVEIEPVYGVYGTINEPLTITVEGGEIASEEVAMRSSVGMRFIEDEHVLLFLREDGDGYKLVDSRGAKFSVGAFTVISPVFAQPRPLADVYGELADKGRGTNLPDNWEALEEEAEAELYLTGGGYIYNGVKWFGEPAEVEYQVNANSIHAGGPNGTVNDFLQAIIAAGDTWSQVPTAAFSLRYVGLTSDTAMGYNGTNAIVFRSDLPEGVLGLARYWYSTGSGRILEADMAISDLFLLDTTGNPGSGEVDLESAVLHEFGHWLSMGHDPDPDAVMSLQLLRGMLRRQLHANDIDGISYIYPCPEQTCVPSWLQPTPTVTPTPQPTSTSTPTPAPTSDQIGPGSTIPTPGETLPPASPTPVPTPLGQSGDGDVDDEEEEQQKETARLIFLPIGARP